MKVYYAGKLSETKIINEVQKWFEQKGHIITHDWTKNEGVTDGKVLKEEEKNLSRQKSAGLDIDGVKNCDLLFVLMLDSKYAYRGTFTEIGCALGLGKKIIIVCP